MPNVFTTGDVAYICSVAPRTVSKWCDSGELPHYKVPGGQDRRVTWSHLEAFLKLHAITPGLFKLDLLKAGGQLPGKRHRPKTK